MEFRKDLSEMTLKDMEHVFESAFKRHEDQPIRTAWGEDEEGSQLVTKCHQLKMTAQDRKKRKKTNKSVAYTYRRTMQTYLFERYK